jgi:hypothetical protein
MLKESTLSTPVTLKMGELTFNGTLQNKGSLSDEQIDELIEKFMKEHGYDPDKVKEWTDAVTHAKNMEGISKEMADKIISALISLISAGAGAPGLAGATGGLTGAAEGAAAGHAGTALEVILNIITGNYSGAGDAVGKDVTAVVIGNMAEDLVKGWGSALGKATNGVIAVDSTISAIKDLLESYDHRQEQLKARYAGDAAKGQLDKFYRDLQKFIQEQNPDNGWHIVFTNARADRPNFTFFGQAGCSQWWILEMDLKKQEGLTTDKDPALGSYTGQFTLTAEHDMTDFGNDPAKYLNQRIISDYLDVTTANSDGIDKFDAPPSTLSPGTAEITRVITGNATVTVTARGDDPDSGKRRLGYEYKLSMDGDGEPEVKTSGMQIEVIGIIDDPYSDIVVDWLGIYDINSEGENIIFTNLSTTLSSPYGTTVMQFLPAPLGWDDQIWKPWESEKTMSR